MDVIDVYDFSRAYETGIAYASGHWFTTDNMSNTLARHQSSSTDNIPAIERTWSWTSYFGLDDAPHTLCSDGTSLYALKLNYIYKISGVTSDNPSITQWAYYGGGQNIMGLCWDGSNVWGLDYELNELVKFGSDGSILASYSIPYSGGTLHALGLAYDGTYFWIGSHPDLADAVVVKYILSSP
jgi:hypothetical protein